MDSINSEIIIDLPDEAATHTLAEDVAAILRQGDVVALSGGLGVGKTTFARALLRAFVKDAELEVPSPTFTLVQTYSDGRLPVAHFDFYRLADDQEFDEIGFEDAVAEGAVLVEWPERALSRLPGERLDLVFDIVGSGRVAVASGDGGLLGRFRRSLRIREFLGRSGWTGAGRRFLQGDASSRSYERVECLDRKAVLMDWPSRASGAGDEGRLNPYRADDVSDFVAVGNALRGAGLSTPEFFAADEAAGFLLMEDFGSVGVVAGDTPIAERYGVAVAALAKIHNSPRPADLPSVDGAMHHLPSYGAEALIAELELLVDWYLPYETGELPGAEDRRSFVALWAPLLGRLNDAEKSWALLDVHSPNLLWLPDRNGIGKVGFLDFQDALIGPSAYDVASLAQDARITVPVDLERELLEHYLDLRRAVDPDFDAASFLEAYAILAAQRATRILGTFARLAVQAKKTAYLQHIPRVRGYLARTLGHPVLSGLAVWYEKHRLL